MIKRIKRKILTGLVPLLLSCTGADKVSGPPQPPQPPQQQNRSPVINSSCVGQVEENYQYIYQVNATDSDGDALTYSVTSPSWLSINSSTGLITGIAPEVSADQPFSFQVVVSDGRGGSGSQNCNPSIKNLFNNYVLSSSQLNGLIVTDSTLTFLEPVSFAVGDIIASGIASQTPYGLLREITLISSDKRRISTIQATLEQVVRSANLSYTRNLTPSDLESFSGRGGVLMSLAREQNFDFGVNLTNVLLYDRDGNSNTTDDQIIANGNISFNTGFDFNIDIRDFNLNGVTFQQTLNETADITVGSTLFGFATLQEITVAEYPFKPIVIGTLPTIPPIPIIAVPKIQVNVVIDPSRTNPLSLRVRQDASLTGRLTYDGSWNTSVNFSNNFEFSNPLITGDWDLRVHAGPRLNLSLFGVAGPFAGVDAGLRLASTSGDWKLYGGLSAYLGISVEILSRRIAAYFKKVLEHEEILAEGSSARPDSVSFIYNGIPVTYGIVQYDGKFWLDRNLGASRTANTYNDIESYGDLFQWGRQDDGHQVRTSGKTSTLAPARQQPGHGNFIGGRDWNADSTWTTRWTDITGNETAADPCPTGWRVPTSADWQSAIDYGRWTNRQDAFNSTLKLPSAEARWVTGELYLPGQGAYWSTTSHQNYSYGLSFTPYEAIVTDFYRATGLSVRCIKK